MENDLSNYKEFFVDSLFLEMLHLWLIKWKNRKQHDQKKLRKPTSRKKAEFIGDFFNNKVRNLILSSKEMQLEQIMIVHFWI